MPEKSVKISTPRTHIRVTINDSIVLEAPKGTIIWDFFKKVNNQLDFDAPLIAAICNGQLRELNYPLQSDAILKPILLSSSDGGRIYRRSLVLLLTTCASELWANSRINVRYAIPDGGYYCTRENNQPFTKEEVSQLEAHMHKIVQEDEPISKREVHIDDAIELFKSQGQHNKVLLLENRDSGELVLYSLRGREDYYYGYMVPSTGLLTYFRLIWVGEGFILQYPRKEAPTILKPITAYEKIRQVFDRTEEWLERLRLEDIGRLNRISKQNTRIQELILVSDALHEQHIAQITSQIRERQRESGIRIVLIAGPSSSGKTTFSKRLAIQLLAHGLHPFTLELDNYFVNREHTPRDADGEYNFEALEAINLPRFNQDLLTLIDNKEIKLPKFDFITGKSIEGRTVKLNDNQIIIIEGIHGLNPKLVQEIPSEFIFRIYVSALTQLNIDDHNRVPTTDVRLIRRIVRDARTRGYNATDTLTRWQSVRRGEKANIFPYQENADVMFNSALPYELAALRGLVEPLLLQVKYGTPAHIEAKRLLSFIRWVHPLSSEHLNMIPDTSILREFIGGSILDNYHPEL